MTTTKHISAGAYTLRIDPDLYNAIITYRATILRADKTILTIKGVYPSPGLALQAGKQILSKLTAISA